MKIIFSISFLFLLIMLIPCACEAQGILSNNPHWVQTKFPFDIETMCVHDNYIFIGGEHGLYRSSNDGDTWSLVGNGLKGDSNPPEIQLLYSYGDYVLAKVVDWGIFRSTDNGNNWIRSSIPLAPFSFVNHDRYIFAYSGMIDRSSDSANTWQLGDSGITPRLSQGSHAPCYGLAVMGNSIFTCNQNGQIFQSTNDGSVWDSIPCHYFLPTKYHLSFYGINDATLFAGYNDTIFRSTDNGINWNAIKTGFGMSQVIVTGKNIFVGGRGIILSTDNGDTWRSVSNDTLDTMSIVSLAINDGFLFAGGYFSQSTGVAGLWRCPLSDLVAKVADNTTSKQTPTVSIVNDNIQFNKVDNNIDRIIFYNATGQIYKEIKNIGSTTSLPIKDFSSGFYEVVFSSKNTIMYSSKIIIGK